MLLRIEHQTTYRYARPVKFGMHRLMIRPIEGHDVQIRQSRLEISVPHRLRWNHDVFGNSVTTVDLPEPAGQIHFFSSVLVEQFNANPFDFLLEEPATTLPFSYPDQVAPDVASYLKCQYPEDQEAVARWIQPFSSAGKANTLDCFTELSKSISSSFQYSVREEPGVQTPAATLNTRNGSCRDFALLFMEGARYLGVAARYVSGYLCQANPDETLVIAAAATHAWAELYLPGAGWKGFDPTCGILAANHHVRTAVTRNPEQAVPIAGSFQGKSQDYLGMDVQVRTVEVEVAEHGTATDP